MIEYLFFMYFNIYIYFKCKHSVLLAWLILLFKVWSEAGPDDKPNYRNPVGGLPERQWIRSQGYGSGCLQWPHQEVRMGNPTESRLASRRLA